MQVIQPDQTRDRLQQSLKDRHRFDGERECEWGGREKAANEHPKYQPGSCNPNEREDLHGGQVKNKRWTGLGSAVYERTLENDSGSPVVFCGARAPSFQQSERLKENLHLQNELQHKRTK